MILATKILQCSVRGRHLLFKASDRVEWEKFELEMKTTKSETTSQANKHDSVNDLLYKIRSRDEPHFNIRHSHRFYFCWSFIFKSSTFTYFRFTKAETQKKGGEKKKANMCVKSEEEKTQKWVKKVFANS